ncbi:UNVERIFIED_CONTAM: hypothetical protein H355_014893 [Colinus virginianus]|nr:hypothetical protein H355_014893 [Colinus virginianus]
MRSLFELDEAEIVFTHYLELARELTAYEKNTFNNWREKYVERYGLLENMLENVEAARGNMTAIQHRLFQKHLQKLDKHVQSGVYALNWTSLGLEEFTSDCNKASTAFKTLREQVDKNADVVEQIVQSIENAELVRPVDWTKDVPFTVQKFYEFFEKHRAAVVEELQRKYESVTSHLIKIEEVVEGSKTGACESLVEYYYYWEKRFFNAISTMLLRGISSFRAYFSLYAAPSAGKIPPLITVAADFNQAEVIVHGSTQSIFKTISKLMQNILSSASHFVRWMDGTCRCVPTQPGQEEESQGSLFTFYPEITSIPALIESIVATHQAIQKVFQNTAKYMRSWQKYDTLWGLWDVKKRADLDKLVDKRPGVVYFDIYIGAYKKLAAEVESLPRKKVIGFLQIEASAVIEGIKQQALEWMSEYARVLKELANRELHQITTRIERSRENLQTSPDSTETFKFVLNEIKEVRRASMDTELLINEVEDMFRTLHLYECPIEPAVATAGATLKQQWDTVLVLAASKEKHLLRKKKTFVDEKEQEVEKFAAECKAFFQLFKQEGPGAAATIDLERGGQLMQEFTSRFNEFQERREELIKAELLLGMPVSSFPSLDSIKQELALLQLVYDLHSEHQKAVETCPTLSTYGIVYTHT